MGNDLIFHQSKVMAKMHSFHIFTRNRMGLDYNIWLTMLTCFIVAGAFLGYSIIHQGAEKPCKAINIFVNGRLHPDSDVLYTDQPITFRSSILPEDKIIWDFGDETKKEQ